jgi:hypothetical protein
MGLVWVDGREFPHKLELYLGFGAEITRCTHSPGWFHLTDCSEF